MEYFWSLFNPLFTTQPKVKTIKKKGESTKSISIVLTSSGFITQFNHIQNQKIYGAVSSWWNTARTELREIAKVITALENKTSSIF